MEIVLSPQKTNLLVRLQGELDHHFAESVRDTVDRAMERDRFFNLIFNLEQVSFMDSSGIGVLLGRYRKIRGRGGSMAVCCASGSVMKVLEISGLPKIISFFDSEAAALEHYIMGQQSHKRRS